MSDYLGDVVTLQHKARASFISIDRGILRVEDHCLLLVKENEEIEIPVAMVSTILIEPGVSVTHEAVKLAAENNTLLVWVGEAGVRVYSAGEPGGKSAERLIQQVSVHLDQSKRMMAAQRLYALMFDELMPETRSIDKLRGNEGARVKKLYAEIAKSFDVEWSGRENSDESLKDALGFATSCLYGLCEAVILSAGYSPAIGIVHSGNARSLVFDLADTVKFKSVVPAAFEVFKESPVDVRNRVRHRCRDLFREQKMAELLFQNLFFIFGEDVDSSAAN